MKIGRGVSELWRVENRPLSFDLAHGLCNSLYYRTSRDSFIKHITRIWSMDYWVNRIKI